MSSDAAFDSRRALIGRRADVAVVRDFTALAARSGGAMLLFGEPGVGKSVLLAEAVAVADAAGTRVLRASGAEFEAAFSFSTLHQVLHPVLADLDVLSAGHRHTIGVALGFHDGPPPGLLVIADAVLALLARAATHRPVLMVVDDLQWVDRASAMVLAIVARRLGGGPIGFLAAIRSASDSFFDHAGLPNHEVRPLDSEAADALVADRFPALTQRVRRRLLDAALGNPLALLELPLALTSREQSGADQLPDVLPLTTRLQAVFQTRIRGLPAATRQLLLLAALDGSGALRVLTGNPAELAPAERTRLVKVDDRAGRMSFRHPLTRSAVMDLSTAEERIRAHALLADLLAHRPERRAWHLAHATVGTDESVARLLEDAAYTSRGRGDAAGAVSALLRAADLSPMGEDRSRRLAEAAYLGAVVTGDLRDVPRLLADARHGDDGRAHSLVSAVAAAHHLLLSGEGDVDTAHRVLVGAIEMQPAPYDGRDRTVVEAFYTLGWVCYFGGRAELWAAFHTAYARLSRPVPELLELLVGTFDDPVRTAPPLTDRIDAAIAELDDGTDPVWTVRLGLAAMFTDRLAGCRTALRRILRDGEGTPAVTLSLHARSLLGLDQVLTGEWDDLRSLAEEHVELCRAHNYRLLECLGLYLLAMLAAIRGEHAEVVSITDRMTSWAAPRHAGLILRIAAQARMLDALARGDHEDAYRHATVITPAGQLAPHVPHAMWVIMDLVEAAWRSGRTEEAAAHVAVARAADLSPMSPRLAMTIDAAAARVAPDEEAFALLERALAVAGAEHWPFDRARVDLAYGERLRRARATADARRHLTAALEVFRRLDAKPWIDRAAAELRATGGAVARRSAVDLTPQQREIAELAAAGLTNKQIGTRLFLSPRTVGTHLYQLFPKLGITSRASLRDALLAIDDPPEDG